MKKSDIYEVAIKILGLYLFVIVIGTLRDLLTNFAILSAAKQNPDAFGQFSQTPFFLVSFFNFVLLTLFASLVTFKTKAIVKRICSPTDFEENAKLFADRKVIYEIALVLTGLLLIVWTLPDFAFKLANYIKLVQSKSPTETYDNNFLITSSLRIIAGLFAILTAKSLATFFAKDKEDK